MAFRQTNGSATLTSLYHASVAMEYDSTEPNKNDTLPLLLDFWGPQCML